MTRALMGWATAVVIGLAPVTNDICGLGCDFGRSAATTTAADDQPCPLHAAQTPDRGGSRSTVPTGPDRCGHDHSIGRAGLTGFAKVALARVHPASTPWTAVLQFGADAAPGSPRINVSRTRTSRPIVLRI